MSYVIPLDRQNLLAEVRKTGIILEENWLDDGVHVKIKGGELKKNPRLSNLLKDFDENSSASKENYVSQAESSGFKKKFGSDW